MLQIWDTAEQERYHAFGSIYYRKSTAAIAVFDLTDPEMMQSLPTWIKTFRAHSEDPFVLLVGNQCNQRRLAGNTARFKRGRIQWVGKDGDSPHLLVGNQGCPNDTGLHGFFAPAETGRSRQATMK
jgi:GTPase SAR1 family protein